MARKSRFWGNFWGETGRNSGKWVSNKIFGNSGWATPRRHIFEDGTNEKSKGSNSSLSDSLSSYKSSDLSDTQIDRIIEMANEISFNSNNIDEICANLDDLLTGARTANKFIHSHNFSNKIFVSKIKAGIMRLKRSQEFDLADFYAQELKSVTHSGSWSKAAPWIFIVIALLFILLMNYFLGNFS